MNNLPLKDDILSALRQVAQVIGLSLPDEPEVSDIIRALSKLNEALVVAGKDGIPNWDSETNARLILGKLEAMLEDKPSLVTYKQFLTKATPEVVAPSDDDMSVPNDSEQNEHATSIIIKRM